LPKWIDQYIIEAHSNMSTDMAISLSKKFIRQISQPFDHTQTGHSLWTLDDILERQRKDEEEAARAVQELGPTVAPPPSAMRDGDQDFDVEMEFHGVDEVELHNAAVAAGA